MTISAQPNSTRPAPRWVIRAAHVAALCPLPNGIWRLLLAAGFLGGYTEAGYDALGVTGWGAGYVVALSLATEVLALLTLALVRPWGETVPRRIPRLGGRRIPPRAVTATAWVVTAGLLAVWTPFLAWWAIPHPGMTPLGSTVVGFLYLPLVLWGPLLAAVTLSYQRRHRPARRPARPR
ncbi:MULTISPECIES: hypothetical protein [unclassified Streptomyces]|uniref:hypothetical protein n=1 Tax=unclassified Streptomyces TaxID=2593676 RepID=UPI0022523402|nr:MULTISPECIES: hypothetical protein [unclassified Streptomyces]MCX4524188.1 hypothetical protein [Streptomyces sp. NBC_01551]MCX4545293.1 hypothetical protein [Streptomyces sp. NBC_01565]